MCESTFEPETISIQVRSPNQCVVDVKYDAIPTVEDEMAGRNRNVEYEINGCRVK
jgi:hypothetical protein